MDPESGMLGLVGATALVGAAGFVLARYRVARSTEYLAFTGLGIRDIKIKKRGIQWPLQRVERFQLTPRTFKVPVGAMSKERIPFEMPAVFTIGPNINRSADDDKESDVPPGLYNYARLMLTLTEEEYEQTVTGIIEGESRILSASMTLDALFNSRDEFKDKITKNINKELEPLGVSAYNSNIEELTDQGDSSYFREQRKRALQRVAEQARVDVAEATQEGDIGTKQHEVQTRVRIASLQKEAVVFENDQAKQVAESDSDRRIAEAEYGRNAAIAEAEARTAAETRTNLLQFGVEEKLKHQRAEEHRVKVLTKHQVDAEALRVDADAARYSEEQAAKAAYVRMEAEARGLRALISSMGNDPDRYNQYLVITGDLLPKIAAEQARAVRDMKPTIWSTGSSSENPLKSLVTNLPPLVEGISQWAGVDMKELVASKIPKDPTPH